MENTGYSFIGFKNNIGIITDYYYFRTKNLLNNNFKIVWPPDVNSSQLQ